MPSFGGEVKPSVPCRRFPVCKRSLHLPWKSHAVGKIGSAISRPYFLPSMIEVSHVAGRGAPLEMLEETKSGAQRARSYGLGASGLHGPGSAPYSTLFYHLRGTEMLKTTDVLRSLYLRRLPYSELGLYFVLNSHSLQLTLNNDSISHPFESPILYLCVRPSTRDSEPLVSCHAD
jgi:hypothetical protein